MKSVVHSRPSLAARSGDAFDALVRARGRSYVERGHVTVLARTDAEVRAEVRGSRLQPYEVTVTVPDRDEPLVALRCDCPYAAELEPCKHMWALLLVCRSQQGDPWVVGDDPIDLLIASGDDDELLPGGTELLDLDDADDRPPLPATAPNGDNVDRNAWRQRLAELERSQATVGAPFHAVAGQLEYHIDPRDSVALDAPIATVTVQLAWRPRTKDGTLGKPVQHGLAGVMRPEIEPRDQAMVELLRKVSGQSQPGYWWHSDQGQKSITMDARVFELVAERLAETGRLFASAVGSSLSRAEWAEPVQLRWDATLPHELELWLQADGTNGSVRAVAALMRDGQRIDASACVPITDRIVRVGGRLVRLAQSRQLCALFRERPLVMARELPGLLRRLGSLSEMPTIQADGVELPIAPPSAPTPVLRCFPPERGGVTARVRAAIVFAYGEGGAEVEPRAAFAACWDGERGRLLPRDRAAESVRMEELVAVGFAPSTEPDADVHIASGAFVAVAERLLESGWQVEVEGRPLRQGRWLGLSVASGIDWFDLQLDVQFDGDVLVDLAELLESLATRSRWVKLGDGSQGLVPEAWLERYAPLCAHGQVKDGKLRFGRNQGLLLDMLLAGREVEVDETFARVRRELRSFDRVRPKKAPRSFSGKLRGYQELGLGWLHFLQRFGLGGCLADDMGLGKTVQVLALLASRAERPPARRRARGQRAEGAERRISLVVAPRSLVFNWRDEAARFTPRLRVLEYRGPGRHEHLVELSRYDVMVTTYGTLRRDIELLRQQPFDYVILDEATAIKNPSSHNAKACRLLDAAHRLALTGTPIENSLADLGSLFEFLNPGMIGRVSSLQLLASTADPDDAQRTLLARVLGPFLLRRTKEQVLTELPEKSEQTLGCRLDGAQRKLYDDLRDAYRASLERRIEEQGLARTKIYVLEALLRLRQVACHPGLVDPKHGGEPSAKLDVLLERLAEVIEAGHKALVFSQFTSLLAIVRQRLEARDIRYAYLDGQTQRREQVVQQFQGDDCCPVFLISLKAGGHGLNLTAADYVFLLDPWWNPAVESQAIDRSHRIGQTRPVFAYRLVAEDTVEQKILALQQQKRELADGILASDQSALAQLDADALAELLS